MSEYRGDWIPRGWLYTDRATGAKANWRFLKKKAAGSTELEFCVHAFSQAAQLVQSPLARCAASGGVVHYAGRGTRDVRAGLIDLENGVRFSYTFCLFAPGVPAAMVIAGGRGSLR